MAMGGAKETFKFGVNYAKERTQFGKSIATFGAIREKIADMYVSLYATESATYRVSGLIEDKVAELIANGTTKHEAKLAAAEEYSIECAALKVMGSETLDLVVDEVVQIFGGMGFSEEAPAARAYRDSRINRIFEGTNEINRLLAVGTIVKRAMKGQLDLMKPAMQAQKDLMNIDFGDESDALFATEKKAIEQAKKAILLVAGGAIQKYMMDFENQQEVILRISDMAFDVFAAESILLRASKLAQKNGGKAEEKSAALLQIFVSESMERIYSNGKKAIADFAEGDMLTMMNMGIKRYTKYPLINVIGLKKTIAQFAIDKGSY
jgi:alkylation response protein AidB-like acyl-CoA dehydrogenase